MTALLRLYRTFSALAAPLLGVVIRRRLAQGKEHPQRWRERLGYASLPRPAGTLYWLHGASVGECLSLLPLATQLHANGVQVLMTSGTVTSAQMLAERMPAGIVHQFVPIDTPQATARFMTHWRPDVAVLAESDLWPNLLQTAHQHGTRLALVSARLSDATARGWGKRPRSIRALLRLFDVVLAQDSTSCDRLSQLGRTPDGVADLKQSAEILPVDAAALHSLSEQLHRRPIVLAASTHPGEDAIVLQAFSRLQSRHPLALLIIAPRHPQRGAEITAMARAADLHTAQRSTHDPIGRHTAVYVADTLGEMGLWYRLAHVAVVGGSLVPGIGGHNPMEPARLGCPILSGPYVDNFEIYQRFFAASAAHCVRDAEDLMTAWRAAITRKPMAQIAAAGALVTDADAALATTLAAIRPLGVRS